ncbi:MAG TPA: alpha/beta hydrolase, partial [Steroidobacteraceae bacterium]|nr:alpha/beta hydrolase [Steroidobacteraceae bacterium]
QAHVVSWICKLAVKRPLVKSPTVATIRRVFNARHPPVPRGCTAKTDSVGGVPGEWMTADGVVSVGSMLYLHGGAYVGCSPVTHRPLTSWFAKQGWRVFAPDYRLAPENQFPAQIDDAVAVYRALLAGGVDPKKLAVAGDSAGGNLTLALCLALRNASVPLPSAIALLSPVTDFTWSSPSIQSNSKRCAMFSKEILPFGAEYYLGAHDRRDPLASPAFAELKGLPPMIFHASSDEILCDDSVRAAERAKQAGVEVQIQTWPVVPHVWQMLHRWIPEGRDSLSLVNQFLQAHVA